MDPARWKRVEEIYHAASERKPEEWVAFLVVACAGDEELQREVGYLLVQPSAEALLDRPAWEPEVGRDMPSDAALPAVGQRVAHYQIQAKLGEGGMGAVYHAYDTQLHRPVALKILPAEYASDPERRSRLLREARVASALNHPNIVSIYEVGSDNGVDFIAMELVEGKSLGKIIPANGMPPGKVLGYAVQIASGLAKAHAAGVVHRDLKPGNIMLSHDGLVKLLDFGLARRVELGLGHDSTLTTEGQILGTPSYMSPEQAQGKLLDVRSDLFSFGVVLYEMLSGKRAFSGDSSIEVMNAVLKDDPPDLPASVPATLNRIVRRCLEKDTARRFQSAADLEFALDSSSPSLPRATPLGGRRRALPWALFGATALVFAVFAWVHETGAPSQKAAAPVLWRLTSDAGLTKDGAISPDGKLAAYASDRADPGNLDIWVQQTDGGEPVRLTSDPADDYDPSFSPDGSRVAFRSEREGGGIYEAPVIGGQAGLLVPRGRRPRFSPDGQFLMYATGLSSANGAKLFVLELGGGGPIPIAPQCAILPNAAWSPDSRRILFAAACPGDAGVNAIWSAGPDGQNLRRTSLRNSFNLYDFDAPGGMISLDQWVPHPDRLLLPRLAGDVAYIGSLPILADGMAASGPLERITYGAGSEERVSASENGRLVLSSVARDSRVWELSIDGNGKALGEPRELTAGLSDGLRGLSRDGRFLAYVSGLSNPTLYLKDLTTGRQRSLSPKAVNIGEARFNAAGTQTFFQLYTAADVARSGWQNGPCRVYEAPTSGGVAEEKRFMAGNGFFWDLLDNDQILYGPTYPDGRAYFEIVDAGGARRIRFVEDPARSLWNGTVSNDGQWVAFNATTASNSQIYIVPYREAQVPLAEWIPVTDGSAWDDKPSFSTDGRMVFFVSYRDGFLCIWAQRLGKDMHPVGKPFTVYHSHQAMRSQENFPFVFQELAVGPGVLLFDQTALTGNIWLLDPTGQNGGQRGLGPGK